MPDAILAHHRCQRLSLCKHIQPFSDKLLGNLPRQEFADGIAFRLASGKLDSLPYSA